MNNEKMSFKLWSERKQSMVQRWWYREFQMWGAEWEKDRPSIIAECMRDVVKKSLLADRRLIVGLYDCRSSER